MVLMAVGMEGVAVLEVMVVRTGEGQAWGPWDRVMAVEGFLVGAVVWEERVAMVVAMTVAAMTEGLMAMDAEVLPVELAGRVGTGDEAGLQADSALTDAEETVEDWVKEMEELVVEVAEVAVAMAAAALQEAGMVSQAHIPGQGTSET